MFKLIKYYARFNFLFKKELRRIEGLSTLSDDQLYRLKEEACIDLFKHAISKSPFYKEFYLNEGIESDDVKCLEDFQKLPVLTKELVRTNLDRIPTTSKLTLFKGYTSGTTGSPLTVYRDWISIITENAYVWSFRMKNGLKPRDWKVSIRGDYDKETLFRYNYPERTVFLSSYNLNANNKNAILDCLSKVKPKALIGYPSSLHILSELIGDYDSNLGIALAFTSSEVLHEYQRTKIENSLDIKIFDWFGNSERTIALQQFENHYEEPPLYAHNEYFENYIVSTGLINNSFPLIRYQIFDRVILSKTQTNGKRMILGIEGRSDDYIITKQGKIGSPGISTSFKGLNDILMCQLIQKELNYIKVKVVMEKANEESIRVLRNRLIKRLGEEIKFDFQIVSQNELEVGNNGKIRLIVSRMDHDA